MKADLIDAPSFRRVEVMVAAPLWQPLSYAVPSELSPLIRPLSRLLVPLRSRLILAFALNIPAPGDCHGLKTVADVLDPLDCPAFPPEMLVFLERVSSYYLTPLGQALADILPAGLGLARPAQAAANTVAVAKLRPDPPSVPLKAHSRAARLVALLQEQGPLPLAEIRKHISGSAELVRQLERQGWLSISHRPLVRGLSGQPLWPEPKPVHYTPGQNAALQAILPSIKERCFAPFLLQGVTGSGKTEVYLAAIQDALNQGLSALLLTPEIGLCLRLEGLLRDRFAAPAVAVLHSGLSQALRREQWESIARGQASVVLGARSAVFAPLARPGLIIVDEEQDESYKQEDHLRYNGRDLALLRGQTQGCPVILGSATPAVTSLERARRGELRHLLMSERVGQAVLPRMEVVDLRAAGRLGGGFLSSALHTALRETVESGRQAIIFLNRRGFAPALLCPDCGHKLGCPSCSLSLTLHQQRQRLLCHACGYERTIPMTCPVCGGGKLKPLGWGTEAVEAKLRELEPAWRILRLDRDSASTPARLGALLRSILRHEADVVVGTQLLSKGHHFPLMSLVGVLLADQALSMPDFRAAERAYTLLTQVSGRAGRAADPGRVIVQTYDPDHHAIQAAVRHQPEIFYNQELRERQALGYPPFLRLLCLRLDSGQENLLRQTARKLAEHLRQAKDQLAPQVHILGPAPAPVLKVQDRYRYLLILKSPQSSAAAQVLRRALGRMEPLPKGVRCSVDVDPLSLV